MRYVSGSIHNGDSFFQGYVCIDNNVIVEVSEGRPPEKPFATGTIVRGLVNCHTHAGDAGLKVNAGMTLEELVAPPNGLKHRYLAEAGSDIVRPMAEYVKKMYSFGTTGFADFREGGTEGAKMLRSVSGDAVILGRPLHEHDGNELDDLLKVADGIGISSITDVSVSTAENIAEHVHRENKTLALHVSERIREDIDLILSLEPDFVVHMTQASDKDMRKCADSDVPVVVCPRSNMYFGMIPPVRRLLGAGVKVALGTDNAMLCDPDLRKEAAAIKEMTGGEEDTLKILLNNGRELLYEGSGIGVRTGMSDICVFPSSGKGALQDILGSAGRDVLNIIGK